jgi:hypothetical protein
VFDDLYYLLKKWAYRRWISIETSCSLLLQPAMAKVRADDAEVNGLVKGLVREYLVRNGLGDVLKEFDREVRCDMAR